MESLTSQKEISDQLELVLSNQERIMSIISLLQMAIGKIRKPGSLYLIYKINKI